MRRDGELVAMAGERMKPDGFTELSGVCTAPGHRGLGYAGALSRVVAGRVAAGPVAAPRSYVLLCGAGRHRMGRPPSPVAVEDVEDGQGGAVERRRSRVMAMTSPASCASPAPRRAG